MPEGGRAGAQHSQAPAEGLGVLPLKPCPPAAHKSLSRLSVCQGQERPDGPPEGSQVAAPDSQGEPVPVPSHHIASPGPLVDQ